MTDPTQQWRRLLAAEPYEALVERVADPSTVADMAMRALVLRDDLQPPAALTTAYEQARPTSLREGLGLTRAATLLAATGAAIDPAPVLRPWVGTAGGDDHERTSLALACAAHGFDEALGELAPFVPGASFGPDAAAFARYVAAAAEAGAADVSTAWTSFAAFFPLRLEAGGLRWTDLLFAGYAVYVRIAGEAPANVLGAIRGFVREVAAA